MPGSLVTFLGTPRPLKTTEVDQRRRAFHYSRVSNEESQYQFQPHPDSVIARSLNPIFYVLFQLRNEYTHYDFRFVENIELLDLKSFGTTCCGQDGIYFLDYKIQHRQNPVKLCQRPIDVYIVIDCM